MKFDDLKIGDQFEFCFDRPGGYSYEKIDDDLVKCLTVPYTESKKRIGQEYIVSIARDSEVRLLNDHSQSY